MEIEDKRTQGVAAKIKENRIVKKLRGVKNIQIIVAIFIIAVALIIYSSVMTTKQTQSVSGAAHSSSVMNTDEQRLAAVLSGIDGAGSVDVMITESDGTIVGVLVTAQGARDIGVRLRLLDAAACALGVSKQIVNVYGKS